MMFLGAVLRGRQPPQDGPVPLRRADLLAESAARRDQRHEHTEPEAREIYGAQIPDPYGPDPYVFGPQYQSRPEPPQGAISVWQCTACDVAWRGDCLTACWLCGKSGELL